MRIFLRAARSRRKTRCHKSLSCLEFRVFIGLSKWGRFVASRYFSSANAREMRIRAHFARGRGVGLATCQRQGIAY
jgi:hypothetical protein